MVSEPIGGDMTQQLRDRLLSVEQVRSRLGCSRSHVYKLISKMDLPAVKIGSRMGIRVKESEVNRFLKDCEVEG
jgi:excisionase family DNA binding protein